MFVIAALGQWGGIGGYRDDIGYDWERFDQALAKKTPDLDSLYREAKARAPQPFKKLQPAEIMQVLYETTIYRFNIHWDMAYHTLFSNWIQWTLGQLNKNFLYIYDPDIILFYGHSAICGQTSYTLIRLAQKAGIRPRHVGLYGHVVMEAWYEGDWHMYDPTMEVVPIDSSGSVLSVESFSKNPELVRKLYINEIKNFEEVAEVILSRENNTFMSYPAGSQFVWKAEVLAIFEQITEVLKFVFPGLLMMLGAWLLYRRNNT